MTERLEQAVINNNWSDIINELFSDEEVDVDDSYYVACYDEDLEEAKRLIAMGYQADNTYLWTLNYIDCECGISGCHEVVMYGPITALISGFYDKPADIKLITKLVDYGLLSIEDIPDEIIFNTLHGKGGETTTQEIIDWLVAVVPPSRLATYRESEDDGFFLADTMQSVKETITILHAILWSHMPEEKVVEYMKTLLSAPEIKELVHHKYDGVTILRYLIPHVHLPLLEILLPMGGFDVNEKSIYDGNTSFHLVLEMEANTKSKKGWKKVAEMFDLLSLYGLDLHSTDKNGNSLSTYIVHYGWETILGKYLVSDEVTTFANLHESIREIDWDYYENIISPQQKETMIKMIEITEPYKYCKDEKIVDSVILQLLEIYTPDIKKHLHIIAYTVNGFSFADDLKRLFEIEENEETE